MTKANAERNFILWEGETHEVELDRDEKFNPNEHLKEILAGRSTPVDLEAESEKNQNLTGDLTQELLTDDNPNDMNSVAWYKYELDSFEGVEYSARATKAELHAALLKAHEEASKATEDDDE